MLGSVCRPRPREQLIPSSLPLSRAASADPGSPVTLSQASWPDLAFLERDASPQLRDENVQQPQKEPQKRTARGSFWLKRTVLWFFLAEKNHGRFFFVVFFVVAGRSRPAVVGLLRPRWAAGKALVVFL